MLSLNITKSDIAVLNYERFPPPPLVKKRLHLVYMKAQAMAHKTIAIACHVSVNSVSNFIKIYHPSGLNGLRSFYYRKPTSKLVAYCSSIEEELEKNPPLTSGQAGANIQEMTGIK